MSTKVEPTDLLEDLTVEEFIGLMIAVLNRWDNERREAVRKAVSEKVEKIITSPIIPGPNMTIS